MWIVNELSTHSVGRFEINCSCSAKQLWIHEGFGKLQMIIVHYARYALKEL
jgi:hypothetical protein